MIFRRKLGQIPSILTKELNIQKNILHIKKITSTLAQKICFGSKLAAPHRPINIGLPVAVLLTSKVRVHKVSANVKLHLGSCRLV